MKNIAIALRNRKLRQKYPKGVYLGVVQNHTEGYTIRAIPLHTRKREDWGSVNNYALAIMPVTHRMHYYAACLEAAGVYVTHEYPVSG